MKAFFSILMSVLLAVSAVSGCCRSYALASAPASSVGQFARQVPCCCKNPGCNRQHKSQSPAPCKASECRGICVYVSSQKTEIDSTQLVIPCDFVAPALLSHNFVTTELWKSEGTRAHSEPPLRLHLLHQILVI